MKMALPTNADAAHLGQVVLDEAVGAQAHPPPGHGQRLAPGNREPGLEPAAAPVGLQQHHHRQHHLGQEPCGATLVAIGHRLHQVASELDEGAHRRRAPHGCAAAGGAWSGARRSRRGGRHAGGGWPEVAVPDRVTSSLGAASWRSGERLGRGCGAMMSSFK